MPWCFVLFFISQLIVEVVLHSIHYAATFAVMDVVFIYLLEVSVYSGCVCSILSFICLCCCLSLLHLMSCHRQGSVVTFLLSFHFLKSCIVWKEVVVNHVAYYFTILWQFFTAPFVFRRGPLFYWRHVSSHEHFIVINRAHPVRFFFFHIISWIHLKSVYIILNNFCFLPLSFQWMCLVW